MGERWNKLFRCGDWKREGFELWSYEAEQKGLESASWLGLNLQCGPGLLRACCAGLTLEKGPFLCGKRAAVPETWAWCSTGLIVHFGPNAEKYKYRSLQDSNRSYQISVRGHEQGGVFDRVTWFAHVEFRGRVGSGEGHHFQCMIYIHPPVWKHPQI